MLEFKRIQNQTQSEGAVDSARPARYSSLTKPLPATQQAYGNQAVQRLLKARMIQAKLSVSEPGDQYEQEADRVADQVMRMPDAEAIKEPAGEKGQGIEIQRKCSGCEEEMQRQAMEDEEEEEMVQPKEVAGQTPQLTPDVQEQASAMRGGGQPLSKTARAFFEPRFGHDFSRVRVHADAQSAESARSVNALAYTVGKDIVFATGRYSPNTARGQHLLAHELTHVLQNSGPQLRKSLPTAETIHPARHINPSHSTPSNVIHRQSGHPPVASGASRSIAAFSRRQRQILTQFGVDPDSVDPKIAPRVADALDKLELVARVAGGDKSIDAKKLAELNANVKITRNGNVEEAHFEIMTGQVSLKLHTVFDSLSGSAKFNLTYEDAEANALVGSLSTQVGLPAITEGQGLPQKKISIERGIEFAGTPNNKPSFPEAEEELDTFEDLLGAEPEETSEEGVGSFFEGAIMGDLGENTSYSAIAGQTAVGFIPIVGQIADIRDIYAAGSNVAGGKEGSWAQLGIAVIAIIPGLDFLKGGSKAGRKLLKEAAEKEITDVAKAGMKSLRKVLSKEAVALAVKELKVLITARRELLVRLELLLANGKLKKETLELIKKARNSLYYNMKSSDLAGALRDKLGVPVRQSGSGKLYDHLKEVTNALNSLSNARDALVKELKHLDPGTPMHRLLTEEKEALDEALRRVRGFLEIR